MALNPIVFTEKVVRSFLRYQLTAYPFADPGLHEQMRTLLSLDETRRSPLLRGPYISLSRPFRRGASVDDLIRERIFHPHMRQRIPAEITHVYGHQEDALRAIHDRRTTLVSTGTGSGKTECFLYPIISKCLELRDSGAAPGISAVIVYPMNALAEDQLGRLRSYLAGTGVTFGMYVGKTPESESAVAGIRMPVGTTRSSYAAKLEEMRAEGRTETIYPPEERCSRELMRTRGCQPRILLTNVKQLELLLTRHRDVELFRDARLDFLVFDEAHTFTGAQGAESACLVRRLRTFCGKKTQETVCIATSATIVDRENPNAAREFASRFFGVATEDVRTVGEAYERSTWATRRSLPRPLTESANDLLAMCVAAVEASDADGNMVREVFRRLTGQDLEMGDWPTALFHALGANEIAFQLNEALATPRALEELPHVIGQTVNRPITEAEILTYLTLGAASRFENRPLLRPVVHGFIRGISGAVVSFPEGGETPRLWLAAEDEIESGNPDATNARFPITTCTTCGQHYLISYLKDFEFSGKIPGGGDAVGEKTVWEALPENQGGARVVLLNSIISRNPEDDIEAEIDDDGEVLSDDDGIERLDAHDRLAPLYFCRSCGSAHATQEDRCLQCGSASSLIALYAVRQKKEKEKKGYLSSCVSCGAGGRRAGTIYREPARPVRATNVADVHVLAQDMVHHSARRRLLVFCDNRQDAAFQAGWMKDHARRFRLRALMAEGLSAEGVSIGDLTIQLDGKLEENEALSRAIAPEVWQSVRREGSGGSHEKERQKFLRIQTLREVVLSPRQAIGLEPWGRMNVDYQGLTTELPWIRQWSSELEIGADELREGVAGVLDYLRRQRVLFDSAFEIFTRFWMDGDPVIQRGYVQQFGPPRGTKLRRESTEKPTQVTQWISERGDTTISQLARKWGVPQNAVDEFLEGLFGFLRQSKFLAPVRLKGSRGNPLPGVAGVLQVNGDLIRLHSHRGYWRCTTCRRRTTRRMPKDACPAWRCSGRLSFVAEDPDNYDLQVLDQRYSMLRPEEHTAMVPNDDRERLENLFKGDSDAVNTFVCTPTLELGVDIGQLDAILMRNVPPLPANYWQRAGRAGRRHRMAVDITYCRPVSHDRSYFKDPLKLLTGKVDPPAFNLKNDLMVAKHVHATVITRLHQYTDDTFRSAQERDDLRTTLATCLPERISEYLFADGQIRQTGFDAAALTALIEREKNDLLAYVESAFRQGWPEEDAEATSRTTLERHVLGFTSDLQEVVARLARRLKWAVDQMARLNRLREKSGALDPDGDALFRRCDQLIKRMKGAHNRSRRDAEGYDDVNTFGVLAAEGFLPGYGLDVGSILGSAEIPFWQTGAKEFSLPRPPSVALREYVPGNLIYANGNRFVARRFHRDVDEYRSEMPIFEVNTARQAVKETSATTGAGSLGAKILPAIAVSDVDLVHQSHISDEEDLRFQLGVSVFGLEKKQHNGGTAHLWGTQTVLHRRGVRLRLVNVGASVAIERYDRLGYPVCTTCGQSVSPLSSDKQRDKFTEDHFERCKRKNENVAFYADVTADVLSLPKLANHSVAFSILEAIRFAATRVIDMHMEDLQLLVIGHVDCDEVDALLWDPMPGGSGLLDQVIERFDEIFAAAQEVVAECPSACKTSCIDCLQTFRNGFYHRYLDRNVASEVLSNWGGEMRRSHPIPPMQIESSTGPLTIVPNNAEEKLRQLLMHAGFAVGQRNVQIALDHAIGTTTPDVTYRGPHHDSNEGVCIYLDGLSKHIHGNPETAEKDRRIRMWLQNNGYDVMQITVVELDDENAMVRHFRRLAGYLQENSLREKIDKDRSWFRSKKSIAAGSSALRRMTPQADERYIRCVPLMDLKVAAGAFGASQIVDEADCEWVEIQEPQRLRKGMFVAKVEGSSMEPTIRNGSYCLFAGPVTGSRKGKIVLVQLTDQTDPESGQRFTVKRYHSEKSSAVDDVWRHVKVVLQPINPDFEPIVLTCDDEGTVRVVAEFVAVVG